MIEVLLKATFSGGYGTGRSSLYGTDPIADGKSGHFTVCLDLELIHIMFVKQNLKSDAWTSLFLQTNGPANGILREKLHARFTTNTAGGANFYLDHPFAPIIKLITFLKAG
jgi:hypothetical protein